MRKAEVQRLSEQFGFSQRHACELMKIPRSTCRYRARKDDSELRQKLIELSREQPRYGYLEGFAFTRGGQPLRDFRGAWEKACEKAGVPDLRFHDLRRSAVVRMRRAGVPQVVRMKITGHKTDSMDRRYGIIDTEDIELARRLVEKLGKG